MIRCKPGGPRSREAIVKMLLDNGADVNDADFHGFTPIHFASIWGKRSLLACIHGLDFILRVVIIPCVLMNGLDAILCVVIIPFIYYTCVLMNGLDAIQ